MPRAQTSKKKVANPKAVVPKELDTLDVLDTEESAQLKEVKEVGMGVSLEDDTTENTGTKAYFSSIVNNFRYFFPITHTRSFAEAVQLGAQLIPQHLHEGQVLCMNPSRNTPFLFIPSCNIVLSYDNPEWTFDGLLNDTQKGDLMNHIHNGDLVLGTHGITKVVHHMKESKVNAAVVLSEPTKLRDVLKKLVEEEVKIDQDGSIYSPGVEIRTLKEYELSHENRASVLEVINSAYNQVRGSLEMLSKKIVDDEFDSHKVTSEARTKGVPMAEGSTLGSYL